MNHEKFPKVPTGWKQLSGTAVILAVVIAFEYLVNPDTHLSEEMKRFVNRAGATLILYATVLGAWGALMGKKNKEKADMAARHIAACTEGIRRMTEGGQDPNQVKPVLDQTKQQLKDAERAKVEASQFEDDVVKVTLGAIVFVAVGTLFLILAA